MPAGAGGGGASHQTTALPGLSIGFGGEISWGNLPIIPISDLQRGIDELLRDVARPEIQEQIQSLVAGLTRGKVNELISPTPRTPSPQTPQPQPATKTPQDNTPQLEGLKGGGDDLPALPSIFGGVLTGSAKGAIADAIRDWQQGGGSTLPPPQPVPDPSKPVPPPTQGGTVDEIIRGVGQTPPDTGGETLPAPKPAAGGGTTTGSTGNNTAGKAATAAGIGGLIADLFGASGATGDLINSLLGLGGDILSNEAIKDAIESASGAERDALLAAIALQEKQYEQTREDLAPWRETGTRALEELEIQTGLRAPGAAGRYGAFEASPGYQFAMDEGTRAVERSNQARGLGDSGRRRREIARYASGLASTDYDAYRRTLMGMAGLGQQGTAQGVVTGSGITSDIAGMTGQMGVSRASSIASGGQLRAANIPGYIRAAGSVADFLKGFF